MVDPGLLQHSDVRRKVVSRTWKRRKGPFKGGTVGLCTSMQLLRTGISVETEAFTQPPSIDKGIYIEFCVDPDRD